MVQLISWINISNFFIGFYAIFFIYICKLPATQISSRAMIYSPHSLIAAVSTSVAYATRSPLRVATGQRRDQPF
jgi:hypothetical protein